LLQYLIEAGLTPQQALIAATSASAIGFRLAQFVQTQLGSQTISFSWSFGSLLVLLEEIGMTEGSWKGFDPLNNCKCGRD